MTPETEYKLARLALKGAEEVVNTTALITPTSRAQMGYRVGAAIVHALLALYLRHDDAK